MGEKKTRSEIEVILAGHFSARLHGSARYNVHGLLCMARILCRICMRTRIRRFPLWISQAEGRQFTHQTLPIARIEAYH